MSSNKELQDLITSIYIPMLFYIPSRILAYSPGGINAELASNPVFNCLYMGAENDKGGYYNEGLHALEIYKKETVLNSNLFKLLEIKGRKNEDAFKFLIEQYLGQVNSYLDTYIWLADNVMDDIPSTSKTALDIFNYQKFITEKHLEDLKKHFKDYLAVPSESFESLLLNNERLKDITKYNSVETTPQLKDSVEKEETLKQKRKTQRKVVLATEEEVDNYLLKTVFNVRF